MQIIQWREASGSSGIFLMPLLIQTDILGRPLSEPLVVTGWTIVCKLVNKDGTETLIQCYDKAEMDSLYRRFLAHDDTLRISWHDARSNECLHAVKNQQRRAAQSIYA